MKHRRSRRVCSPMCAIMLALFVLRGWPYFRDSKYHAHQRRDSVENRSQALGGKISYSAEFRESDFLRQQLIVRATFDKVGHFLSPNPCCSIHPHSQIERRDEIGWPSAPPLLADRRKVTNLLPRCSCQPTPITPTSTRAREQPHKRTITTTGSKET